MPTRLPAARHDISSPSADGVPKLFFAIHASPRDTGPAIAKFRTATTSISERSATSAFT